ncbi:hypothetical protein V501_02666 [Pseudogymnoascus sp. VKM F-4519 (FW-2642)]|nr:hypothetical protein V501_02666 [Pseudogymnoascus sp. VKM F-4519 (FW-2642)]
MALSPSDQHLHLHYTSPALQWSESLPVGNGRLGAMVYGRTDVELMQLNEDSVWHGGPMDRTPKDALRMLPKLRQLIRDESHEEAEALIRKAFFASPASMRHYEPLGTCTLEFGHEGDAVTQYHRHLDLSTSQTVVQYKYKGVSYRRETIASFPDDALLIKISSSEPTQFVIRVDRMSDIETETNVYLDDVAAEGSHIILRATPGGANSNRLSLVLGVTLDDEDTSGTIEVIGDCLVVTSMSCKIALGAQTTYRHSDPTLVAMSNVDAALAQPWDQLLSRHRADYATLFDRVQLRMWPDACHIPTDERIQRTRDPGLVALYHNYGLYLLISSSRNSHKALPATLQGIWNTKFAPPWGSKYTINVNLQMNYWPAKLWGLIDCVRPVIDLLERMAVSGHKTAQLMYGCGGWCAHHNTDMWGDTSPQDRWMPATLWPLGGLWLSVEMMDTLRSQFDEDLHKRVFKIHEGAIQFVLDFLVPSACGQYLVTSPSLSPENTFIVPSGAKGVFCEGSTFDMTLIRVAFDQFLWSLDLLGDADHPLRSQVQDALQRLPPLVVNDGTGLIQEWGLNNYEEDEPGHRHVSHLFGLHPADVINPIKTPLLAEAAKKVLQRRREHGGGHTGWSRAWLLNFHARLFDAEGCGEHADRLLGSSTLPNMLDTHPPFQIDGNFGGSAGILECLVQSNEVEADSHSVVEIRLLPACPSAWKKGKIKGIQMKQGWLVSFGWDNDCLVHSVVLESTNERASNARVVFPDGEKIIVKGSWVGKHHL